ncbi:MAG: efflux RND transporter periplasmic adaptor subunit [Planctomycetota bacterium]|nr:efflux RND transporter periplasmic adaptor subunit [Planctomycetota bacterium]
MDTTNEGEQAPNRPMPVTHVRKHRYFWLTVVAVVLLAALAGSGITYFTLRGSRWLSARVPAQTENGQRAEEGEASVIRLEKAKWKVAGLRIEPAQRETLSQVVQVTGKLALNEDRLPQIYSQVEGLVHEVPVYFGQEVAAGQRLVVIDSQQIGLAKLELIKSRLATRLAEVDYQWQQTVETNVQALIESLRKRVPLAQIEETFLDRDMGDYRSQLVSAYARLHKSQADYERLNDLSEQRITAGKDLLTAQAALEADQATMLALLEQIKFTSSHSRLAAEHELQKA